jgi:uncharacterized membrane protein
MSQPAAPSRAHEDTISQVSAWILRIGVVSSSIIMLGGIAVSFTHGTVSLNRITSDGFDYYPSVIWNLIIHGHGKGIIEAGIYLLVFTPIMRIVASILLFAFQERDRLYTVITLVVLILTLAGLLWLG